MRVIYSSAPFPAFPEHRGKVFAVIGPFESFGDKPELQIAIEQAVFHWREAQKEKSK